MRSDKYVPGGASLAPQTGSVATTCTATAYYAAGWRTLTDGMELLPGTYTFGFNDGSPNTQYTLNGGAENHIH